MPVIESLALVAALAQPSSQTTTKDWFIDELVQHDASTWVLESLAELDTFLSDREVPDALRPTGYSFFTARERLVS
jgi:hypothetical protein